MQRRAVRPACIAAGVFTGVWATLRADGPAVNPFLLASLGGWGP
jgi:hypothetical protein